MTPADQGLAACRCHARVQRRLESTLSIAAILLRATIKGRAHKPAAEVARLVNAGMGPISTKPPIRFRPLSAKRFTTDTFGESAKKLG
jgi:hypothetical protein